jgi:hypothetical protein
MEHGVRNSLVVAQCQLHLNFWVTTKLWAVYFKYYTRRVLSGEFIV